MKRIKTYHGGAFFEAIGTNFTTLDKANHVINADVLDAWFDPSPKAISKIREHLRFALRTSPPTHCEGLAKTISEQRGVPLNTILVGGGSSDIMFAVLPQIIQPSSRVMILDPMYGEYAHILKYVASPKHLHRHILKKDNEFQIETEKLYKDIKHERSTIVIIVNPNSPTGAYLASEQIIKLAQRFKKTLFIIDETYIEYVGSQHSLEKQVTLLKNLVVIKSMSKVYALSGARVGYMVGPSNFIEHMSTFFPPWSVNLIGQIAAIEALQDSAYYTKCYAKTHREKKRFIKSLKKIPTIKVYSGMANFVLIELLGNITATELIKTLKTKNIFIRNSNSMSIQFKNNFVRIAIKNRKDNTKIINALCNALC